MREAFGTTGEIASLDIVAALLEVARERRTASVRFLRPGEEVLFGFRDGDLVSVAAPERYSPAEILIRSGKIQAETYRRLTVAEGGDRFAIAISSGVVSRREATWAQKIAAIEALASLVSWTTGTYSWHEAAAAGETDFRLPVNRWVLEFFLRSRDRSFVMQRLGPTDAVLVRTERFDEEFPTLGLTADADAVVGLVDGKRSIAEIARRSPSEEFAVFKLLAALLSLALLRPEWDRAPIETPAPISVLPPGVTEGARDRPEEPPAAVAPPSAFPPTAPESFPEPVVPAAPPLVPEVNLFALTAPVERPGDGGLEAEASEAFGAPGPAPEEPLTERPRRRPASLVAAAIFCLAAIAVAISLSRRREAAPSAATAALDRRAPRGTGPRPVAGRLPPAPVPATPPHATEKPAASLEPGFGERAVAPGRPPAAGRSPEKSAPEASTPKPSEAGSGKAPAAVPSSREPDWPELAERGRRIFEHPQANRFTVQLEIACEPETLRKAYAQDRSGREIWITPYTFRGRRCYRVLWGKFASREAARDAASEVPKIFREGRNRPAVVALRAD